MKLDEQITDVREWFNSTRFAGITRLHSARQVAEQRGTIETDFTVAREAAGAFYERLRAIIIRSPTTYRNIDEPPLASIAAKRIRNIGTYSMKFW